MKYLLLSCIIVIGVNTQAQMNIANVNKRIVYQLEYQFDSTDVKAISSERFFLDIGDGYTFFRSETTHLKDSILKSNNPNALFGIPKTRFNYTIIKDQSLPKQKILYDFTAFKFALSNDAVHAPTWEITDESKTISGYHCTLAKTSFAGRDYEAWFSSEIPILDGPYKFGGLPGLIIELYDTKKHYHFIAIGTKNLTPTTVTINTGDFKEISKEEFKEFEKKVKEKPSLILYNPGIQIPQEGLDKYDRNHKEANKKRNNPIELAD